MQTYRKAGRGFRPVKLMQEKIALDQLKNMSNLVAEMGSLAAYIDSYPDTVTNDNIKKIANDYAKREHLSLTEEHINMVLKKYTE